MDFLVEIFIKMPWTIFNTDINIVGYKISLLDCIIFGFMFGLFVWAIREIFDF